MSVVLGGCSVYRTYKRPDVAVIDSLYRQQISPADSVASIADLSWKELFTDPHLQKLIETGLCNNSDLGIARLRAEEADFFSRHVFHIYHLLALALKEQ